MIYIIELIKLNNRQQYKIFDTHSESSMTVDVEIMYNIIANCRSQVINAYIQDNSIILKKWPKKHAGVEIKDTENEHSVRFTGSNCLLVSKNNTTYKVVCRYGSVHKLSNWEIIEKVMTGGIVNCRIIQFSKYTILNQLLRLYQKLTGNIESDKSTNCSIIENFDIKIKALDVQTIQKDTEFEKEIALKYKNFNAKTKLLYHESMAFDYEIEGQEVRISKYIGSSKNIILPSFVTSIMYRAFWGIGVETIKLNEGLKTIATEAFISNRLEEVELPSTVEIVGNAAFRFNEKLFTAENKIDTNRFKLLNNKTILLDQYAM